MAKIISCKALGKQQTYDLEVNHKDHQFYTANGLLTSNSHSDCYAYNSYHCAWLYTYHEEEWLRACLECDPNLESTIDEIRALGFTINRPDVNLSEINEWSYSNKAFTPSLTSLKGLGVVAARELIQERKSNGKFSNAEEFFFDQNGNWRWNKVNKKSLSVLIRAGAFESLDCVGGESYFANYKHMFDALFDETEKNRFEKIKKNKLTLEQAAFLSQCSDWTTIQKLEFCKEILGFYDKNLILKEFLPVLKEYDIKAIDQTPDNRAKIDVWGVIENVTERITKKGRPFLVVEASGFTNKKYKFRIWRTKKSEKSVWNAGYVVIFSLDYDEEWGFNLNNASKNLKITK